MTHPHQETDTGAVSVSAFVRPTMLLEPMDSKLETLYALEEEGTIDNLSVRAWPEKIPDSPESVYTDAFGVFDLFETWAEATGVRIQPPFDVQTTDSAFRGDTRSILRTPVMALAVAIDDNLYGVFPHADGDTHYRVTEAIAALKAGAVPIRRSDTAVSTGTRMCPECGGELVNVQGVEVCHDCAWNDWVAVGDAGEDPAEGMFRPTILPAPG